MTEANENPLCTDEQALLWLADRRQESRAVRCLARRCFPKIRAHVLKNSGSADEAREMLFVALTVLTEKVRAGQYRPEAPLEAFVFSVAHHKWMDVLRRRKRDRAVRDGLAAIAPEQDAWDPLETGEPDSERQLLASQCFPQLGETCQRVLEMYYLEKKKMKEIAEALGFSGEDSAKTMKYKCLQQLKSMVGGDTKF